MRDFNMLKVKFAYEKPQHLERTASVDRVKKPFRAYVYNFINFQKTVQKPSKNPQKLAAIECS